MALAGLGFQGTSSKYVQSTRDINTQLRKEPKEDESANFMNVSLLPGEIGKVVGYDGDKWVRLPIEAGARRSGMGAHEIPNLLSEGHTCP
jgi:hypothetical protein